MTERGSLGEFIKSARERLGMSQGDLESVSGCKRDYVGAVEIGRVAVIYPETFGRLKLALRFPGWACLEAMGFETDVAGGRVLPELVAALALLDGEAQRALLFFVESLKLGKELGDVGTN